MLNETVDELLRSLLPSFYGNSQRLLWGRRWVTVMATCHPYLRMGRTLIRRLWPLGRHLRPPAADDQDARAAMLDVVHALTALTMACFLLAVLYDFQYPEGDGSWAAQLSQATCESRKMLLDPFQSQCLWQPDDATASSSSAAGTGITIA